MARLHLVCGPPGAGKTTKALAIAHQTGAVRMSPDHWMTASGIPLRDSEARELIEQVQWQLSLHFLGQGRDVVIEWGTWGREERLAILAGANTSGHAVSGYFLTPELAVLQQRVAARSAEQLDEDRLTPEEVIEPARFFQNPDTDELAQYDTVWMGIGRPTK